MLPQSLFDQAQGRAAVLKPLRSMRLPLFQDVFHPDPINKKIGDHRPFPLRGRIRLLDEGLKMIEEGGKVRSLRKPIPGLPGAPGLVRSYLSFPVSCPMKSQ